MKARDLMDTGTMFDPQDPALYIRVGDAQLTTERYWIKYLFKQNDVVIILSSMIALVLSIWFIDLLIYWL